MLPIYNYSCFDVTTNYEHKSSAARRKCYTITLWRRERRRLLACEDLFFVIILNLVVKTCNLIAWLGDISSFEAFKRDMLSKYEFLYACLCDFISSPLFHKSKSHSTTIG